MPCYRCGTRQVDPDRGSSPWLRGVKADRHVLICPGCQAAGEWVGDLDRCEVCASVRLVRRLGEVECRDCGYVGESVPVAVAPDVTAASDVMAGQRSNPAVAADANGSAVAADAGGSAVAADAGGSADQIIAPGLAEEVEQALARVFRRTSKSAQATM